MKRPRRLLRLLHAVWMAPLALVAILWWRAGWDARYLARVLWHGESDTDDFRWKAKRDLPALAPRPWPVAEDCSRVATAIRTATGQAMDAYLADGGALGFVVIRDGALACEWYGNGGARDAPAAAFSISKTVTSLVLARAIAAGEIASIDDPITRYVPALAERDPRFAAVTLAALVDMRSGIAFAEDTHFPWVDQDAPAVYYASDLATTTLYRPRIESAPGPFVYNDYAPNLIGLALAAAHGTRATEGPLQALWTELGAEHPAAWSVDEHGTPWLESGFVVTARDLARIGQLVLDDGKVGAHRVAPAAWIARSTDPRGRAPVVTFAGTPLGYRNGWWRDGDDALVAMGRHGQIMVVVPATRTVIVRLGLSGYPATNVAIATQLLAVARAR